MGTPSAWPIIDEALLRAFLAFATTRNFTHAARQVGLSQPALFERIRRLADHAGGPLYEKRGRALELTPRGVQLAAFARDLEAQAGRFAASLEGQTEDRVVLAAGEGAYLFLLGPALRAFSRERPGGLEVLTRGGPSAAAAVRSGEAQLGVGVFDVLPPRVTAVDLVRVPLCAALSTRHRLAARKTLKLSELGAERFILAPEGQSQRDHVGRALAGLGGPAVASPIEADGWPLMLAFAAAGLGVAVVNGCCQPPKGVVLRPIPELGTVTYRLIRRPSAPPSPARDRLAALIVEHARPD